MTWVASGVAVGGAALNYFGSSKAAGQASDAANAAAALQKQQYDTTVNNLQPYLTGGTDAYNKLLMLQGLAGTTNTAAGYDSLSSTPTSADVMNTPGYQFGLTEGQNQLQKQLAASGQSYSGAALKEAAQYANDYATTKYQQAYNNRQSTNNQTYQQLMGTANAGQNAANTIASAGSNYANQAGNYGTQGASASAAGTLAGTNALTGLINQGGSIYNNYTPSSAPTNSNGSVVSNQSIYTNPSSLYAQNGSDAGLKLWADGGPVRTEPVIGSRTPLPQGQTGGGLSTDAIAAQLLRSLQPATQPRVGIAALPANPLMNPRAILENQMQQQGYAKGGQVQGPIRGPGTATSDSIPVPMEDGSMGHLSNGEHVFDTASVNAIGNGSNEVGQMKLNKLRAMLKGGR